LVSPGVVARREESTREAAAMRGAVRCALRSGLACVFALRARATGAPRAVARASARKYARRAGAGAQCAGECALRPQMWEERRMVPMCALPVPRAHRGRAHRGNARVARSTVCMAGRGALPLELVMGSWERSH